MSAVNADRLGPGALRPGLLLAVSHGALGPYRAASSAARRSAYPRPPIQVCLFHWTTT